MENKREKTEKREKKEKGGGGTKGKKKVAWEVILETKKIQIFLQVYKVFSNQAWEIFLVYGT